MPGPRPGAVVVHPKARRPLRLSRIEAQPSGAPVDCRVIDISTPAATDALVGERSIAATRVFTMTPALPRHPHSYRYIGRQEICVITHAFLRQT